jgi:hypothetical protein
MKAFTLTNIASTYANRGQRLEQVARYNLTGEIAKADNLAYDKGADCLGYQIKSARATVCKGTDLVGYLVNDKATAYLYVTADLVAYEMTKAEYIDFCLTFAVATTESTKNGGGAKMRLKSESKALLTYLAERV